VKCIHEDRTCSFRKWVCRDGECWWNCGWVCPYGEPPIDTDCPMIKELGFCPYLCIYEALEGECPHKQELMMMLKSKYQAKPA